MSEILIKAKTMHAAMTANISKGDPKSDNIKGLTEVSGIIFSLITTIESQKEEIEKLREIQRLLIFNEELRELTPMQKMSLSMKLLSQEGENK